jgi:hypothetical protein
MEHRGAGFEKHFAIKFQLLGQIDRRLLGEIENKDGKEGEKGIY